MKSLGGTYFVLFRVFSIVCAVILSLVPLSQETRAVDELTLLATLSGVVECAPAGDVNNDGFVDIIAGRYGAYGGRGCAKIYFGGNDFDTLPDVIMIGEEKINPWDHYTSFGSSVASAGDLNKDGYDDVIVGAHVADTKWGLYAGKAYIFFGGSDMDSTADVVIEGKGWYHHLGDALSPAGDVNSDGYDDVIVAAPFDDYDARGRAYIFFGGENVDNIHDVYIEGQDGDFCGHSVTGIGDINGDGFDDVLVGYPHIFWEPFDGKASIFLGGNPMDSIPDIIFRGDSAHYTLGIRVATAGDVNGDSFPDIIIVGGMRGKLFYGGAEVDTVTDAEFAGEPVLPTDFGYSISSAGHLNKDGFSDIIISDRAVKRAYIFLGGAEVDTIPDAILDKPEHLNDFGYRVSSLGDINGDGYEEVTVSSFSLDIDGCKVVIYTSNPTSIDEGGGSNIIELFQLAQNYPNPFNSSTTIKYQIMKKGIVRLILYNILGEKVITLIDQYQIPGAYRVNWDGKDYGGKRVASGIYFYELKWANQIQVKKLILLK